MRAPYQVLIFPYIETENSIQYAIFHRSDYGYWLEDIKKGLGLLEGRKAYVDIESLAPDVASIYKKLNLYEESNYFLELALNFVRL